PPQAGLTELLTLILGGARLARRESGLRTWIARPESSFAPSDDGSADGRFAEELTRCGAATGASRSFSQDTTSLIRLMAASWPRGYAGKRLHERAYHSSYAVVGLPLLLATSLAPIMGFLRRCLRRDEKGTPAAVGRYQIRSSRPCAWLA